ncbi:hypothetical protein HMPREF0663_11258 [Hoylesella oralis ATCC 33269]|uniref:Uncharacterized protein n=1 Tax=Hoylesella oralis ATCC 33269 TaxID=873533 RepID=E7RQ07_9BACT|nr:hypothetical protein HMPREF0663_11258 [Hoylesella oralis ATCC 33269]
MENGVLKPINNAANLRKLPVCSKQKAKISGRKDKAHKKNTEYRFFLILFL